MTSSWWLVGHPAGGLGATTGVSAAADTAGAADGYEPSAGNVAEGDVVPIGGFASWGSDVDLDQYQTLAQMAAVLLVVPTFLLVGAAARLTTPNGSSAWPCSASPGPRRQPWSA